MSSSNENEENEQPNKNLAKFHRAAEISMYVKSVTIGPTSEAFDKTDMKQKGEEKQSNGKIKLSPCKSEDLQVVEKLCKMDINDIMCLKQQILDNNNEKTIKMQVTKKLEEKKAEEIKKYNEIKRNTELMMQEAERKHQLKLQEYNRQIQRELEKENQEEMAYQEQRKALAANTKKIQEEKERELREKIKKFDDLFGMQEAAFLKMNQSVYPEFAPLLDSFNKQFILIKSAKDSQKNSLEGTKAACIRLDLLCQVLQKEIKDFEVILARRAELEEEERLVAQLEAQKKEVIVPKQIVAIHPTSHDQTDQMPAQGATQSENLRMYSEYCQLLNIKKEQTKTLDEAPELQQLRFALKLAINNAINLINEKYRATLVDGHQKLFSLLSGQRVTTSKGSISITDHNEASDWCRLKICEKLIDRCDKEPGIAFFAAALTIALWQKFPDFGEIFKAMLYKECPFFMPFKPPKLKNQSNEEFMASWGYRLVNGKCEEHVYYEGRITKFASLLGALWITFPKKDENEISPFDITHGWRYLANVLNSHPDSNYLHIIGKLLEICGFMLHQMFGKQFLKLMIMIRDSYIPAVQSTIDEETSACFNRLKDTVGKFFTENKFAEPKGRVILGYW